MRGVIAQQIKDLFQTHRFASLATRLLALILHFVSLPFARAVIDAVATYDDSSSIYGVGTICLTNGISPSETIPHSTRSLDEGLTLIGVAFIASWHGYDRVIRGLAQYREKTGPAALPVRFLIVGEGGEKDNLRQLCEAAGVSDLVEFTGPLSGLPLTEAYSSAQVGVGVLGLHRIGLEQAAALKHREYCLLGLPFIWSSHDGGIPDDFPFALHCAADDSPIDIGEVIAFVQSLPDDYQTTMHAFALKNLTWRTQFQTVFERLDLIRDPG
ncbi:MAG: glycosyltransferase [Propionibacteriaceae bacterium]|jgi:glycosyltransferase involved in cell wall biosynthesis|nr:glycosyltransferase [Propionibacteriaceae bacterium]